ncbi:MAG TPA: sodium-dependent transporter [Marinobacter sp.]|nr:sodium-dependent transporter [Marinobacter sp.]
MSPHLQAQMGSFTRKSTFFWAATGATVGLANFWQFPHLVSRHGGGLFILLYLACLLLITLPLAITEASFGRYSRHGMVRAMDNFVLTAKRSRHWVWLASLSVLAAFVVLSYTAVFGAIALAWVFFGASGDFTGSTTAYGAGVLSRLVSDPQQYPVFMAWHGFFLLLVAGVSMQGVVRGLERAFRLLVPATLILLAGFIGFAVYFGESGAAITRMLALHPQDVTMGSVRAALFHAFFTLGLGVGVWVIFGAYSSPHTRLKRSVLAVVLLDTLVAVLAGLALFAVVDVDGNQASRGFGLLFVALPAALGQLPASQVVITLLFLMLVMVIWAGALALMEPVIGWLRERTNLSRGKATLLVLVACWLLGLVSLYSLNIWSSYRPAGATLFRWLELISGGVLIPIVGVMLSLFAGWCLTRRLLRKILGNTPTWLFYVWYRVMRWVLPLVVVYIGLQYTAFSLSQWCDDDSRTFWCNGNTQAEMVPAQQRFPETRLSSN